MGSGAVLAPSDALLRALAEHAPGFAAVLDAEARLVFVSPSVEWALGWPPDEVLGRPVIEFVHPEDVALVAERLRGAGTIAGLLPAVEVRLRRQDGGYAWVEAVANNLLDDPEVGAMVVNAHDVTARRRAEERFRAVFDSSAVGMALIDGDGRILEWNAALQRMLRYEGEELRGLSDVDITHPDDVDVDRALADELLSGRRSSYTIEKRYVRRDGSTVWGRLTGSLLSVGTGSAVALDLVEDVTEERAAKEALTRAEERYRLLVERLPAVTYIWELELEDAVPRASTSGTDEPAYYTSPQIEELLGYTVAEWHVDDFFWRTRIHPDDREAVHEAAVASKRDGSPFRMEYRYLAKDGRTVWVLDEAVPITYAEDGRPWLFQGVMIDITDRKAVEETLRETTERLGALVDSSPVSIVTLDLDGTVRTWNAAAEAIFGWSEAEAVGRFLPQPGEEGRAEFESLRDRLLAGDERFLRLPLERRRKDGSTVSLNVSFAPLRDRRGVVDGVIAIHEDVTQTERARARASEAEDRYRTLVEQIPAITFVDEVTHVDDDVVFDAVYVSPQVEEMLGYRRDDWSSKQLWPTILHPRDHADVLRIAADHVSRRAPIDLEYRLVSADGRTVWVREQSAPLPQSDGRLLWQGVLYDITEAKERESILHESEAELRRSLQQIRRADEERRRVLAHLVAADAEERGRMAEGIEDDSIQHMAAVGMRLEALRQRLTDPEHLGAVDRLGETVRRALDRLRSVLVELRPRALEQDGLAEALRQFARMSVGSETIDVDIEDRLQRQPDLEVRALAYRIAQEAIANAATWSGCRHIRIVVEERDGGVGVSVEDDGVGSEVDATASGGGQSMIERAELAGGRLRVRPRPGGGTTVELWLPGALAAAQ